jgi:hypothetical protein
MKIQLRASRATTSSKGFYIRKSTVKLLYIIQYCINTAYFSPLQVNNKAREGVMNMYFFLILLARLRTLIFGKLNHPRSIRSMFEKSLPIFYFNYSMLRLLDTAVPVFYFQNWANSPASAILKGCYSGASVKSLLTNQ